MLANTCNIEAAKIPGFETAILRLRENVNTQPAIITERPKIMEEQLMMRIMSEPSFRKLLNDIKEIATVVIVKKIKFSDKNRYAGS